MRPLEIYHFLRDRRLPNGIAYAHQVLLTLLHSVIAVVALIAPNLESGVGFEIKAPNLLTCTYWVLTPGSSTHTRARTW